MMIDTEQATCPHCGVKIEVTSQTVVDRVDYGAVVLCMGYCSCTGQWYQWYDHYCYQGHMGLEAVLGYHAR
jgi:hypothetical protein